VAAAGDKPLQIAAAARVIFHKQNFHQKKEKLNSERAREVSPRADGATSHQAQ
jgi:hypothetical protein